MDNIQERKNAQIEQLQYILRGYLIPCIGVGILVILSIFIYIPTVSGIFADVPNFVAANNQYSAVKQRISYFKGLSTAKNQLTLANKLLAINATLPDQQKAADDIIDIEQLAQTDGLQITNAASDSLQSNPLTLPQNFNSNLGIDEITFNASGTPAQAEQLFTNIDSMKPIASVTSATISGELTNNPILSIIFVVDVYSLDSSVIGKSINMLNPINTSYNINEIDDL